MSFMVSTNSAFALKRERDTVGIKVMLLCTFGTMFFCKFCELQHASRTRMLEFACSFLNPRIFEYLEAVLALNVFINFLMCTSRYTPVRSAESFWTQFVPIAITPSKGSLEVCSLTGIRNTLKRMFYEEDPTYIYPWTFWLRTFYQLHLSSYYLSSDYFPPRIGFQIQSGTLDSNILYYTILICLSSIAILFLNIWRAQ